MSSFYLRHGETRNRTIDVAGTKVVRREIYCVVHGWLDRFLCGNFEARHGHCGGRPGNGAEFEEKVLAKAA